MKINVGRFLKRVLGNGGGGDPVEQWLRTLLINHLARFGPQPGRPLELGHVSVSLLEESYTVALVAEKKGQK